MTIRKITPQFNGSTHASQVVILDGVRVRLDTYTNKIDSAWYLDVFDADDNPLITGLAIASGLDLFFPYHYLAALPPGALFVNTQTGEPFDPTLDTWENDAAALYYQEVTG